MGERDAFGREKGEDSLAGLGWRTPAPPVESQAPAPEPVVAAPEPFVAAPEPVTATRDPVAAAPEFQPAPTLLRLRRRRPRGFVRLIVLMAIIVVVAVSAGSIVDRGRDAVDDLRGAIRDAVPSVTPPPPVGLEGDSLFRPAELRAALKQLPAGRIESLRVAPERIDAQVIVDKRMHLVQVTSDGRVTDVETPATGRGEAVKVAPGAPARIVRTAARRAGRDPSTVSYLVLMRFSDKSEWQLFFTDGLHFSASAGGTKLRRVP